MLCPRGSKEFKIRMKKKNDVQEYSGSERPEEIRNKFMTYFLLFFPTMILVSIPSTINGGIALSVALKGLVAFYQFVTLKTFVDNHYE